MPKSRAAMSREEWEALGPTLDVQEMADAMRSSTRYIQRHAKELGGRKLAGRWQFGKRKVADLIGIDE